MPSISDVDINALGRGERIHKQKDDLTVDVWKDRRRLRVLCNHVSPLKTASLDRWDENRHRIAISCPQAVHDYFYHARSVDVINQLHYSYLVGRKSKKWWSRLVWWLIDMSIVNAFILWKIGKDGVNQLQFREQLMRSCSCFCQSRATTRKEMVTVNIPLVSIISIMHQRKEIVFNG
jgi:hypothetical protein